MAFVQGKCKECGGILAVDDTQEATICPFCNKPFVVKSAIENYNSENGVVEDKTTNDNNKETNIVQHPDFIIDDFVGKDGEKICNEIKKYIGNSNEVVIPSDLDVELIGHEAFKDSCITSVLIPNGIKYIGYDAFHGCKDLKSVFLPKKFKSNWF